MSADPSSPRLARLGSKISCSACRESKIRCLDNESQSSACRQCSRKGLPCKYPARLKPGRRPKGSIDSVPGGQISERSTTRSPIENATKDDTIATDFSRQQIGMLHRHGSTVSPDFSTSADPGGPRSRLDMSLYLEPSGDEVRPTVRPNVGHDSNNRLAIQLGDPIMNDLLSAAEAEMLLRLFIEHLNPMISLFDPVLHTLAYLRSTSSPLVSVILAMSAKFFRSDLHLPLLRHYHTISSRALQADECSTALVQGLMVDVYWKEVKDVSAWRKIGAAIRMGYQMRWHDIRQSALPASDYDARIILDAERTWLCLICFDSTYSSVFELPRTIQRSHFTNVEIWAQEHLHLQHHHDNALAFVHETGPVSRTRELLARSDSIPATLKVSLFEDLAVRARDIRLKWFESIASPVGFNRETQQHRLWWILHLETAGKLEALRHDIFVTDEKCLDVIELAKLSLDVIDRLSEEGILRYMQDAAAAMLSRLTAQLVSVYQQFLVALRPVIISLLRRMRTIVIRSSNNDPIAPTAFVARYVHHALETLSSRSRITSPIPQPSGESDLVNQSSNQLFTGDVFDFQLDEDNPFTFPSSWAPEGNLDSQYWASLFPSLGDQAGTFPL